jgi:hypothetical protein
MHFQLHLSSIDEQRIDSVGIALFFSPFITIDLKFYRDPQNTHSFLLIERPPRKKVNKKAKKWNIEAKSNSTVGTDSNTLTAVRKNGIVKTSLE